MDKDNLYYTLALTLIPGIGAVNAKNLVSYCGSAEKIFKASHKKLTAIPGIGTATADAIVSHDVFKRADKEMEFIEKRGIECLLFTDVKYPQRLRNCADSPLLLFYLGNGDLNKERVVGIVGTRNSTDYGKKICEELIEHLKQYNILMVSGLAYGIDIAAHKASVKRNVSTVGVVAHGLDRIYPPVRVPLKEPSEKNMQPVLEKMLCMEATAMKMPILKAIFISAGWKDFNKNISHFLLL